MCSCDPRSCCKYPWCAFVPLCLGHVVSGLLRNIEWFWNKVNRLIHKALWNSHAGLHTCVRRDKVKGSNIRNIYRSVPISLRHFKTEVLCILIPRLKMFVSKSVLVFMCVCVCVYGAPLRKWNKLIVPLLCPHVSFPCCYPNEIFGSIVLMFCARSVRHTNTSKIETLSVRGITHKTYFFHTFMNPPCCCWMQ